MCVNPEEADVEEKISKDPPPGHRSVHGDRKGVAWRIVSEDGSTSVWPSNSETDVADSIEPTSRHSTEAKPPCDMPRANSDLGDVWNEVDLSRESTVPGNASRDGSRQTHVSVRMKPAELDERLLRTIEAWSVLSSRARDKIIAVVETAMADDGP